MVLLRLLPQQLPYDMHRGGAEEGTHCSESMPGHQASVSSSVKWANTPSFQGQCEDSRRELEQQREECGLRSQTAM